MIAINLKRCCYECNNSELEIKRTEYGSYAENFTDEKVECSHHKVCKRFIETEAAGEKIIEEIVKKNLDALKELGARKFSEWLLVNNVMPCIECNCGDKTVNCKECANEYVTEWMQAMRNGGNGDEMQ